MHHPAEFLIRYGYLLVFFWLLAEQGALPLPSLPLLLACGALVRTGQLNPAGILLSGMAACLIADNVWFTLGRLRGGKILRFLCRVALEPDSCVRKTENAFVKYGVNSLLVSKFVPGLNAVAAPLAGSSGTSRSRFLVLDTAGALIWLSSYLGLGYIFSDQIEEVGAYAARMGSSLILLGILGFGGWVGWKYFQRQRFLRKMAVARISPEQLMGMLDAGEDVLVLDLRGELESAGDTIRGALRMSSAELEERHSTIPRDRDIILFCS
jgi:membrane protein DedA with SNARE-associated domain